MLWAHGLLSFSIEIEYSGVQGMAPVPTNPLMERYIHHAIINTATHLGNLEFKNAYSSSTEEFQALYFNFIWMICCDSKWGQW